MASDAWGSLTTASELGKREGWYSAPSRGRAGREEGTGGGRGREGRKQREKKRRWVSGSAHGLVIREGGDLEEGARRKESNREPFSVGQTTGRVEVTVPLVQRPSHGPCMAAAAAGAPDPSPQHCREEPQLKPQSGQPLQLDRSLRDSLP